MKKNFILSLIVLLVASCVPAENRLLRATPAQQTIQQMVNAAQAGDVILVPAGNYPEQVTVAKSNLTIRCAVEMECTAKRFDLWGSNITLDGFKLIGGLSYGVDVRQHNNIVRNVDISDVQYDFTLPRGQGAAVGIAFFGTGHTFDGIYIHDIDQYHVDDLGYTEPHQDCFITWGNASRGGSGAFITISNVLCDMPQYGDSYVSKIFASSGGSHDWTVRNLVGITPLQCLFYDEAHHIDIAYSTFIGAGHPTPQGCKFLKLNSNPAPHDNSITHSIFTNMSGTAAILETGNAIDSHHNCYWNVPKRTAEPGDVYANPLLLPDYNLGAGSPCAGMGAFPLAVTPTATFTPTTTQTAIPTNTPTKTPTATAQCVPVFDVWVCDRKP